MKLNPYQRIPDIQQGHIDTDTKFSQLTNGIDFQSKTVIDLGCNLGRMCDLAAKAGAKKVLGIDKEYDFIQQARSLYPKISFNCSRAEECRGNYDIGIASAMIHYIKDLDLFFKQTARVCQTLILDIWLSTGEGLSINKDPLRTLWIPTKEAFMLIASRYWGNITSKGKAISPDTSDREIFHLLLPKAPKPTAVLISGPGGCGKTTKAKYYSCIHKYCMLETDTIFIHMKIIKFMKEYSVQLLDDMVHNRDKRIMLKYRQFIYEYLERWIRHRLNLDMVIEGYMLNDEILLNLVVDFLKSQNYNIKIERREPFGKA